MSKPDTSLFRIHTRALSNALDMFVENISANIFIFLIISFQFIFISCFFYSFSYFNDYIKKENSQKQIVFFNEQIDEKRLQKFVDGLKQNQEVASIESFSTEAIVEQLQQTLEITTSKGFDLNLSAPYVVIVYEQNTRIVPKLFIYEYIQKNNYQQFVDVVQTMDRWSKLVGVFQNYSVALLLGFYSLLLVFLTILIGFIIRSSFANHADDFIVHYICGAPIWYVSLPYLYYTFMVVGCSLLSGLVASSLSIDALIDFLLSLGIEKSLMQQDFQNTMFEYSLINVGGFMLASLLIAAYFCHRIYSRLSLRI